MNTKILFTFVAVCCATMSYSQCLDTVYTGDGTFYSYSGVGNCSFPRPYTQLYTAALNAQQYGNSELCGACAEVTGPRGSITVSIEDKCPECAHGDLDLEQAAFPSIGNPDDGRVDIRWKIVPCPVSGPIVFQFKEGSSQWWTAVQVRNHRYPISKFEYKNSNGTFVAAPKANYNYFLVGTGMGPSPYTFRITDIIGQALEFTNIPLRENDVVSGDKQLASCTVLATGDKTESYQIKVYPNPAEAKTRFVVNDENFPLGLEVYDLAGRTLSNGSVAAHTQLPIALPEKGTYILKLTGPQGRIHFEKLIAY